jgi:guanine deaminase
VIRQALLASNTIQFSNENYVPLSFREAFALATIGGAQVRNSSGKCLKRKVLGLEQTIGNFAVGKAFDALVIDPYCDESPFDIFSGETFLDIFQKFIFMGNSKNIESVFVNGKKVK